METRFMKSVPESEIRKIWDILHKANAIYQQAAAEGIDISATKWSETYSEACNIDMSFFDTYRTPCCFFRDTINQAIYCKITYKNYLKVLKYYGIKVEV